MKINWRKPRKPSEPCNEGPDWGEMYGRSRSNYRPPRRTAEEREQDERDEADLRHDEFVADMKRQGHWDAVDDPDIAAIAYEKWEAKNYPPKYAKQPWE
jgi:hypothetical protein